MNIPGFTAAVSLYMGSQSYHGYIRASKVGAATAIAAQRRSCPPLIQLGAVQPLACYVYDHQLRVGNRSKITIPKGTPVTFTAKLENAGAYCATVLTREPIPPHLYGGAISGQPLFDNQAPCQAWQAWPTVFTQ